MADLVLLGDSLIDWGDWPALLARPVANHGVAGDTTADVLARLGHALAPPPRRLALLVGVNDLLRGADVGETARGIVAIVEAVRRRSPATRILVQSLLPVGAAPAWQGTRAAITEVNARLAAAAGEGGFTYADVASALADGEGALAPAFTTDGLHLSPAGYRAWAAALAPWLT